MKIRQTRSNTLSSEFAELIKRPNLSQNICICRENGFNEEECRMIFNAIKKDKKLYKKIKKVANEED